jgi:hypothetical protein
MHPRSTAGVFPLAFLSASAFLAAQESPPTEPASAAPRLGQVASDVPVRCWPTEHSPTFADTLKAGDVVRITAESGGFFEVELPLGATGYVHEKFASAPNERGMVKANGKRVSFRHRPRSTEAPVSMLDEGTELYCMGEEEDWYLVRNPLAKGHVPVAALTVPDDQAALAAALPALEAARRAEWQRVTDARVAMAKAAAELQQHRGALQALTARFRTEAGKPWRDQKRDEFQAIEAALADLAPKFASGSTEAITAASLGEEVGKQVIVLDAQVVAAEKLPPAQAEPVVRPATPDPTARFDLVGWVRVVSSSVASRSVRLMRGGKVLGYLTCSSDRYDLPLFDGAEVGVSGPKEASNDGAWQIDVQRLEVLSVTLR